MPTALDMPHLELLVAVAESGSLNGAAAELGLTQPALSYRLREAERRLGAPLFVMLSLFQDSVFSLAPMGPGSSPG